MLNTYQNSHLSLVVNNVVPARTGHGTSRSHPGLTPAQVRLHHEAIARSAPSFYSFRLFTSAPYLWAVQAKAGFVRLFDERIAARSAPTCVCCHAPVVVNGRVPDAANVVTCTSSHRHHITDALIVSRQIAGAALLCGYCRARGAAHVIEAAGTAFYHPREGGWNQSNARMLMLG